nr:hypothetical protein [Tanacetum cinerariifolium]
MGLNGGIVVVEVVVKWNDDGIFQVVGGTLELIKFLYDLIPTHEWLGLSTHPTYSSREVDWWEKGIFLGGFLVEEDALEAILKVIKNKVLAGFSRVLMCYDGDSKLKTKQLDQGCNCPPDHFLLDFEWERVTKMNPKGLRARNFSINHYPTHLPFGEKDHDMVHKMMDIRDSIGMGGVDMSIETRNIVTNSRVTPSWREIVSLNFSKADALHMNWTSLGYRVPHRDINAIKAQRLANTHDPLAFMENTQTPFHPDPSSPITYIQHPQPNNNFVPQPSFNTNYMQQPMQNPKDISYLTTAIDMSLALMAKAFTLNNITPTKNNQRSSSNPSNMQIAQLGEGHYANNCTVKPRKRDVAYLQQQLQIAQEEEARIQSTQEEFKFMAAVDAYE